MKKRPSWSLFLSHQYRATHLNLFFYKLFSEVADVQFEVDRGEFATNVTRLERKIRAADAFVGIYPFSKSDPTPEKLRNESRYFRLELDLATRSNVQYLRNWNFANADALVERIIETIKSA